MTRPKNSSLALMIGVPLLIALVGWGASRFEGSKLDTYRFVTDSSRREARYQRDSVARSEDRQIMQRIDSRVGEIYCGRLPIGQRAGCR